MAESADQLQQGRMEILLFHEHVAVSELQQVIQLVIDVIVESQFSLINEVDTFFIGELLHSFVQLYDFIDFLLHVQPLIVIFFPRL